MAVYHQLRNIRVVAQRKVRISFVNIVANSVYVVSEPCAMQIGLHIPEHTQTFVVISGPWHVGTLQGAQGREVLMISSGIYLRRRI